MCKNRYDLRLGKLRLSHGNLLARVTIVPEDSPCDLSTVPGSLQSAQSERKSVSSHTLHLYFRMLRHDTST